MKVPGIPATDDACALVYGIEIVLGLSPSGHHAQSSDKVFSP